MWCVLKERNTRRQFHPQHPSPGGGDCGAGAEAAAKLHKHATKVGQVAGAGAGSSVGSASTARRPGAVRQSRGGARAGCVRGACQTGNMAQHSVSSCTVDTAAAKPSQAFMATLTRAWHAAGVSDRAKALGCARHSEGASRTSACSNEAERVTHRGELFAVQPPPFPARALPTPNNSRCTGAVADSAEGNRADAVLVGSAAPGGAGWRRWWGGGAHCSVEQRQTTAPRTCMLG
jgi:hypothetical protein